MRNMNQTTVKVSFVFAVLLSMISAGCTTAEPPRSKDISHPAQSYAFFSEYGTENVPMKPGLNRRALNTVDVISGDDVELLPDGSVRIQPGTYRLSGFSMLVYEPPADSGTDELPLPGYCMLYPCAYENDRQKLVEYSVATGNVSMPTVMVPSRFETIVTFEEEATLCLGHQNGHEVTGLYLIYVDGDPTGKSTNRMMAQVGVMRLHD
jgi:hypothetical protein